LVCLRVERRLLDHGECDGVGHNAEGDRVRKPLLPLEVVELEQELVVLPTFHQPHLLGLP